MERAELFLGRIGIAKDIDILAREPDDRILRDWQN